MCLKFQKKNILHEIEIISNSEYSLGSLYM